MKARWWLVHVSAALAWGWICYLAWLPRWFAGVVGFAIGCVTMLVNVGFEMARAERDGRK